VILENKVSVVGCDTKVSTTLTKVSKQDLYPGVVVAFTSRGLDINCGIVVKQTDVKVTIIYGFECYHTSYPTPHWVEYFNAISRYPHECVLLTPDIVADPKELAKLLDLYNLSRKTDLQLKFN
jgi:hypothetical protein